ncbi:MotA/TolQ/ExbB proton channel family protein [Paludisphaera mucosa]|uniref:MotA/TolQ/ExbB proton channel family protein n=1 Tax=Paludisphaera mucosa TaxID=3030827 RepID=A0ABT6F500_9BACT|nr:MotA/TolQ/ExbB proton channel family protein [Paludisphaera mucosa]MDG3002494.1 MotA/TolQ/ExbB proton channel family protein [Paludisphaera mucosa]
MESRHGRAGAIASWLGIGLLAVWLGLAPQRATAQDAPGTAAKAVDSAPAAAGDQSGDESFLRWMIRASGLIGVLITVMSFYLVALIVWMAIHYRTSAAAPRSLVRETRELLDQKRFGDAYTRLMADRSLFARVLAAGVQKLPAGVAPARRAMEMANEDATMEMEHRTTYLATVGTLGPMIGLVGTVYGMIKAFRVIATKGTAPQASLLAEGISTALFATLEGIAISIPAIYFYALFRNRIARMSLEAEMAAEPLLEQFAPGVKAQEPAPPAPAPAGPGSHPHPFALNAALAASSVPGPRSALPPAHPE